MIDALDLFYPILPDAAAIARLVPHGVKTVQLRFKATGAQRIRAEIRAALEVTIAHECQLIVNDHWREALEIGCDYVHLGQEDLIGCDVGVLKARGVRLGLSTHSLAELEVALKAEPDYVALGPIYETTLKVMPWAPQGLAQITTWKARIGQLPLVAIGGITLERAPGCLAAGASSIAVVSDVMSAPDSEARTREWVHFSAQRDRSSIA